MIETTFQVNYNFICSFKKKIVNRDNLQGSKVTNGLEETFDAIDKCLSVD